MNRLIPRFQKLRKQPPCVVLTRALFSQGVGGGGVHLHALMLGYGAMMECTTATVNRLDIAVLDRDADRVSGRQRQRPRCLQSLERVRKGEEQTYDCPTAVIPV
uniref:Uncharacterized protein n=1 Tax=Eutreptiella gymnastica TaxID=73025 RepID=A0A7S4L9T4_9EUGL